MVVLGVLGVTVENFHLAITFAVTICAGRAVLLGPLLAKVGGDVALQLL